MDSSKQILVVGAGMAGLSAATRLADAGHKVLVAERGRSVGGRLATRQIRKAQFDTGAQFFTVRSPEFQDTVDQWLSAGLVDEWNRGFGNPPDGYPRYRAKGGMRALVQHLFQVLSIGDGITVVTRAPVNAIVPGTDGFTATYDGAVRDPDNAAAVVLTAPLPQTIPLLKAGPVPVPPPLAAQLANTSYHRVIAVLLVLDEAPDLGPSGARQQPDDPTFTFIANNQVKGLSPLPAVTFHLAHERSADLWAADDAAVLAAVNDELRATIGAANVEDVQVKRWRYAGPVTPFSHSCDVVAASPGPLLVAGDAYAGAKVEGAFLSGRAAAGEVVALLNPDD